MLVNGRQTVDFSAPDQTIAAGHIALQCHDAATVVEFESIEVKELPPPAAHSSQPDDAAAVRPVLQHVNLLKHIDPKRDAIYGEWRKAGNVLSAYGGNNVNLEIPYAAHRKNMTC